MALERIFACLFPPLYSLIMKYWFSCSRYIITNIAPFNEILSANTKSLNGIRNSIYAFIIFLPCNLIMSFSCKQCDFLFWLEIPGGKWGILFAWNSNARSGTILWNSTLETQLCIIWVISCNLITQCCCKLQGFWNQWWISFPFLVTLSIDYVCFLLLWSSKLGVFFPLHVFASSKHMSKYVLLSDSTFWLIFGSKFENRKSN